MKINSTFSKFIHILRKWQGLNFEEKRLHLELLFLAFASKICIAILPFKLYSRTFGKLSNEHLHTCNFDKNEAQKLFKIIEIQSKFIPWKPTCLLKTHTAAMALRRKKVSFLTFFGLKHNNQDKSALNAHAWIEVGDEVALGKDVTNSFTTIATYSYIVK